MFWTELRYSFRNLLNAPAFALTAILTLALGIGASAAVFTVIDTVLLKPLHYRESGQLVVLWERVKFLTSPANPFFGPNPRHVQFWKEQVHSLQNLCVLSAGTRGVSEGVDHPFLVGSVRAQPNLLNLLRVQPLLGRDFTTGDAVEGREHVVIISYSLWQKFFHGDAGVIGKSIRIANSPHVIIGVLPSTFTFPRPGVLNPFKSAAGTVASPEVEILTPLAIKADDYGWNSDYGNYLVLARLKPGASTAQAEAELNQVQMRLARQAPAGEFDQGPDQLLSNVQPMQEAMVSSSRSALWMLMAAIGGILLMACVNLANAQLGRALLRQREAAVRSALGASKWQLLWSSLSESLLLSLAGGVAGILLAYNALGLFLRLAPIELPRMNEIHLNGTVLLFALLLSLASGVLFGGVPALRFIRTDLRQGLQQNNTRSHGSRQERRLRAGLIGVQVFGCTLLLLVTGLFAESLFVLLSADRGLDTSGVVAAEVNLPHVDFEQDQKRIAFDDGALRELHKLPGVTAAALYSAMPLEGETWIDGISRPDKPMRHNPLSNFRWVSSEYFQVVRERLVTGRYFNRGDDDAKRVIISEAAAKAAWPGEDPIGHPLRWQDSDFTVIGVVADAHTNSLKLPPPSMVYLPYRSLPPTTAYFLIRTAQAPVTLVNQVRSAIWKQNAAVTIARVKTLDSQVQESLASERFLTAVLISFGVGALLLAMLGVYGILSYTVAARTREFGLRMALGATRSGIYSLTMLEVATPVVLGLLAGWASSRMAVPMVDSLLFGVTATDWPIAVMVGLVLLVCAAAAAFVPAHRAASADPMQALRAE